LEQKHGTVATWCQDTKRDGPRGNPARLVQAEAKPILT